MICNKQAEGFVQKYLRQRSRIELPANGPLGFARRGQMLVAHWFDHRSCLSEVSISRLPFGCEILLAQLSDLSGWESAARGAKLKWVAHFGARSLVDDGFADVENFCVTADKRVQG